MSTFKKKELVKLKVRAQQARMGMGLGSWGWAHAQAAPLSFWFRPRFPSELTMEDSDSLISCLRSEWLSFSITKGKGVFRSLFVFFNLAPSDLYIIFISSRGVCVCVVYHVDTDLCLLWNIDINILGGILGKPVSELGRLMPF